jgi:hypothetical protein
MQLVTSGIYLLVAESLYQYKIAKIVKQIKKRYVVFEIWYLLQTFLLKFCK